MTDDERTWTIEPNEDDAEGRGDMEIPRLVLALSLQKPLVPGMRASMVSADEVLLGRGARSIRRDGRRVEVTIEDEGLSRRQLILRRLASGWELEDLGSKNGTLINGERCVRSTLVDWDVIEVGSTILLFREAGPDGGTAPDYDCRDRELASESESGAPLVFRTLALELERLLSNLTEIASSRVPVLLRGETGTGKELIARAIHDRSARRGPFVAVNCGALPRTLVESELFGYRRGAFSDAREDREGLMLRADGGTIFLDEIVELPAESQVALLRVLQDGEVRPIGTNEVSNVNVRVIAATNQDVARQIAAGRFRQDLYARLAGFELELPPLRERREDLGTLIAAILRRLGNAAAQVTLHRQAARALLSHEYPMNIRELEQALRAAVVLAHGRQIRLEHLPSPVRERRPLSASPRPEDPMLRERLHEILSQTRGNVAAAARAFNKAPIQIRRWCRRFSIDLTTFRD